MIFSKTTTYAIRILIFMAGENREVFSAQYLFDNLAIHNRYMRRVLTRLTNKGFLKSIRGRKGGFAFSRPPEKIFLSEIIEATEGMDTLKGCIMGITDCRLSEHCTLHYLWEDTREKILAAFSNTSLMQLIHGSEFDFSL
jgi:Rrf2 family protein